MIKLRNKYEYFFLISLIILLSAYFIEYALKHKPCVLCIYQRIPFFSAIILSLYNYKFKLSKRFLYMIFFVIFLASTILASYHVGVENNIFSGLDGCSGRISKKIDNIQEMKDIIFNNIPSCNRVDFRFLSVSLAAWNMIISFILTYQSFKELKQNGKK